MSGVRGDTDFVGHIIVPAATAENFAMLPQFTNWMIHTDVPEHLWLNEATAAIGEWRARFRSTYMRWALALNGLEVAASKYSNSWWARNHQFTVSSLRPTDAGTRDDQGRTILGQRIIAKWDGETAAQNHLDTMPMLAMFGVIDLYARLEEFVFRLYRIYLNRSPDSLIRGIEGKELRKLRREAEADATKKPAWEEAWRKRLNAWQRKKLYAGLGQVFRGFCNVAKLKTPSVYKVSTIDSWADSINTVALVRNALMHGVAIVPPELATACKKPNAILFDLKEGEPLDINLRHLQGVDCFCEQLLSGINLSMLELHTAMLESRKK